MRIFSGLTLYLLAMGQQKADQCLESISFPLREAFTVSGESLPSQTSDVNIGSHSPQPHGVVNCSLVGKSTEHMFLGPTLNNYPNPKEVKTAKCLLQMKTATLKLLFLQ